MINVKRLMSIGCCCCCNWSAHSLFSTGALAAAGPAEETGAQYGAAAGEAFIDEDGDGVCDNVGTNTGNAYGYGDSRGTGECDGTGVKFFVDADG